MSHIRLNENGKEALKTDKDTIRIYQFHQDHVFALPEGFKVLGYTDNNTENQITISEDGQCLTIQGHPEFSTRTMRTMIEKRKETGVLPSLFADTCLNILDNAPPEMESVWFVEKILDFIHQ